MISRLCGSAEAEPPVRAFPGGAWERETKGSSQQLQKHLLMFLDREFHFEYFGVSRAEFGRDVLVPVVVMCQFDRDRNVIVHVPRNRLGNPNLAKQARRIRTALKTRRTSDDGLT